MPRVLGTLEPVQLKTLKAPIYVHLELTRHCNLKCFYCSIRNNNSTSVLAIPLSHFEKIIDKLVESEVFDISLFGGEPFLSPHAYKLAQYAKEKGMVVGVITNGSLIKEEDIDKIPKLFSAAGFALNGIGQIHDNMVGVKGSFDKTVNVVKRLSEQGFGIAIDSLVCKSNINYLDSFLSWIASNLKVMLVNINLFYSYEGLNSEETFSYEDLKHIIDILDQHSKTDLKNKINLGTPIPYCLIPPDKNFLRVSCSAGWMYGSIDITGNMRMCPWSSKSLGNILDTPISEIWNNSKELEYYRSGLWMDPICDSCPIKTACGGGCKVTSSNPPYSVPKQWKPYINPKAVSVEAETNYDINLDELVSEINLTSFSPNPNIRLRKEEEGFSVYLPLQGAYWLNNTAIEIYYLICKEQSIEKVIKIFGAKYNLDYSTAENDVKQVLYKLYKIHFFE